LYQKEQNEISSALSELITCSFTQAVFLAVDTCVLETDLSNNTGKK